MSGPDRFGEYYHRLRQVKEHHRRYPNDVEEPMQMEFLKVDKKRVNPPEELPSESVADRVGKHCHEPLSEALVTALQSSIPLFTDWQCTAE